MNIPGNQITVEAVINRTSPYSGGFLYAGDIVSKHKDPVDINYLLRPSSAEITTTNNGYVITPPVCDIELNKTYHVAMVYDGSTLKFYRNGFLMSQVAASGNLLQNSWPTQIGYYQSQLYNENFIGYINEVRIWNVARTQSQIRAYMNTSLPSPSTQTGLQAYYVFDDLSNKQGNAAWNGILGGTAQLNQSNPTCGAFVADSCKILVAADSVIINSYTEVLGYDPCANILQVADATSFNTGDTVLLAQMKGGTMDITNTASSGSITNYNNVGNYEYNTITQKNGNSLVLKSQLQKAYDIAAGGVQLVRVPYYSALSTVAPLTCLPWDGKKGGILAFNVQGVLGLQGNLDVSSRGFRKGLGFNINRSTAVCSQNDYIYPPPPASLEGASKGEGVAFVQPAMTNGKGSAANGGGGGNEYKAGGGGGSNIAAGGYGGYQSTDCGPSPFDNRGIGGYALTYGNALNKVFMGGGGGTGHCNNPSGFTSSGGSGGGIIMITAGSLQSNGYSIISDGEDGLKCVDNGVPGYCSEGMGGGGAGGTILASIGTYADNAAFIAKGGKGADMSSPPNGKLGPGGGGGGGICWFSQPSVPPNVSVIQDGGLNGVNINYGNDPWGATPGSAGSSLLSLSVPIDNTPFVKNIDSVRFTDAVSQCTSLGVQAIGYTKNSPITDWKWDFGDGTSFPSPSLSHPYSASGTYTVKLVGSDINNCKDSITGIIVIDTVKAFAGTDTSLCNGPNSVTLHGSGGTGYDWTPATLLDDPTKPDPVATLLDSTRFYVTVSDNTGCTNTSSVLVAVRPRTVFHSPKDQAICKGGSVTLSSANSAKDNYSWTPTPSLDNPSSPAPLASPDVTTVYTLAISDPVCHTDSLLSLIVNIKPAPQVVAQKANDIDCMIGTSQLNASGALSYLWIPANGLNDPRIADPMAIIDTTTQFIVQGTGLNGCTGYDSVIVKVTETGKSLFALPNAFTPNGDGHNDCFGIQRWGSVKVEEFSIYNRWGQRIFTTRNAGECWDGNFAGKPQETGAYVYVIKAKSFCGEITRTGTVMLIR